MQRSLTYLAGLVTLTATAAFGCFYLSSLFPVSPRTTVRLPVPCASKGKTPAANVQVLSTHRWSQGVVVLYSALCPGDNPRAQMQPVFGHQVVKQDGINWQVSGSDSYRTEKLGAERSATSSEKLVRYSISKSTSQGNDRYAILYGQVLKPKVTAVEATFDNGQVVRDESGNGVFALIAPGSSTVCELRVLGADNQILQQELTSPRRLTRSSVSPRCLPGSRQS
ncbi:MAG TPA: hypothetical protein V6D18_10035 [Thermosynechococcaceae cyanobacterium]